MIFGKGMGDAMPTYKLTFDDESEAYLAHHGVKGMHWGVRNAETMARYASKSAEGGGGGVVDDEEDEEETLLESLQKEAEERVASEHPTDDITIDIGGFPLTIANTKLNDVVHNTRVAIETGKVAVDRVNSKIDEVGSKYENPLYTAKKEVERHEANGDNAAARDRLRDRYSTSNVNKRWGV